MKKMFSWTLLLVVLIIFGSGAVAVYTVFFMGDITVPPLRERSVVEAVEELKRLDLVAQTEYAASTLPEGRVLGQSPEPGTKVRKKQVVVLQVSRGGELHAVPDVRGQTLANAQSVIKEQGFTLGDVIRIREKGHTGGTVIAQSPASPANIPVARKIDLLVQDGSDTSSGANGDNNVIIPDVNRMTEKEARNLLEASGLKIQTVDRVYSPVMPDGLAIETRPGAGTSVKAGDSVRLKIATLKRPAGYSDATTEPENSRRVTSNQNQNQNQNQQNQSAEQPKENNTQTSGRGVKVSVAGQGDIFIGDGTESPNTPIKEANPDVSVFDQEGRRPGALNNRTQAQNSQRSQNSNSQNKASAGSENNNNSGSGNKTARFRYQVPPLITPMDVRIEITDPSGRRELLNRRAKSGENISLEAKYDRECLITIFLGGELVGQQRYR